MVFHDEEEEDDDDILELQWKKTEYCHIGKVKTRLLINK